MQSCWLPPSQRPSVAEVFLLLSSLLAAEQGMARGGVGEEDGEDDEYEEGRGRRADVDESFERRWDLLRPPAFQAAANERRRERDYSREDRDNSYPILDPVGNCITPTSSELDDILTVTETSKGLNFEYFWEKAHARRGYKPLPPPQPIPTVHNNHRQSLDTPTVVPVISAHSPSLASEYYIRLEEHTPQDKSPTLKGKVHLSRHGTVCPGDMELVEIRSGMLGKERMSYSSTDKCGKDLQTVRTSEVQLQVPQTGVTEFGDNSYRVTDFSVVDLGDDEEVQKKSSDEDKKTITVKGSKDTRPIKPRSMSMSSANPLHARPLPVPPLGYRGLPHYTMIGKIQTDPIHSNSCLPSTFDHLGLSRSRQTLPPSPSLSPSLPPSSHPIYPKPPQMYPPAMPPHSQQQRNSSSYNTIDLLRYSKPQTQRLNRETLSCDPSDRHTPPLFASKEIFHTHTKTFDFPVRRENPLRPIYRSLPRPQATNIQTDRQSSSSPTYSDEDDSPFMSPVTGGTTVAHSSLSEDADPAAAELFSRGMKRTQSRLDTILPQIWKEDAELQRENVAAAKKSPMHLFLTEISSVTELSESEVEASWDGEEGEGEKWENFVLPNKRMRRSRSLITELGSVGKTWGAEVNVNRTGNKDNCNITKELFQKELFLTEVDTVRINEQEGTERDPVKYLYPAGSRPVRSSSTETEEASSKGIRRSRSLLNEIVINSKNSETEQTEMEAHRNEMTREEFLKEIHSAETFLTELISRQKTAENRKKTKSTYSPTPLSPEYESVCIDPDSTQTITFESESSIRASNKGKEDSQIEAIYAQVTKRAKKCEDKVSVQPEDSGLHRGTHLKVGNQENSANHCQSEELVFSEIMPKKGLLHNQLVVCQREKEEEEEEECADGPALPARGEHLSEDSPSETVLHPNTVIQRDNQSLFTDEEHSLKAAFVCTTLIMKDHDRLQSTSHEKEDHISGNKMLFNETDNDSSFMAQADVGNTDDTEKSLVKSTVENVIQYKELHCYRTPKESSSSAATSTTSDWDPPTDASPITPTDSVLSPMTYSSAGCLTPSDSWTGVGGGGSSGFRALGNETPHRDSAYFSDSDWEGEGANRRSTDGASASRPNNGRGCLTGIEEKTEEEGEEKALQQNDIHTIDRAGETDVTKTVDIYQHVSEQDFLYSGDDKNKRLGLIFHNENKKSQLLCEDQGTVGFVDTLLSKLGDDQLKEQPHNAGYLLDRHDSDGIISQRNQDSAHTEFKLHSKSLPGTDTLIDSLFGCYSDSCGIQPSVNDDSSVTQIYIDALAQDSSNNIIDTLETKTEVENDPSRIPGVSSIPNSNVLLTDKTPFIVALLKDEVCGLNEVTAQSAVHHTELGLRNLCSSDDSEDKITTETEKQLVATEMGNAVKEKSPLKRSEVNSVDMDSSEELDVKNSEIGSTQMKGEDGPGDNVVSGEFDCHRFSQSQDMLLLLWADENDQWASPEKRCQDSALGSEFFSCANNKIWEGMAVGKAFWGIGENDELAGSEPHPAVLDFSEEMLDNETQGQSDNLSRNQTIDHRDHGNCSAVNEEDVQQEENMENLGDKYSFNRQSEEELPDIERGNVEIPEQEDLEYTCRWISSNTDTDTVGDEKCWLDSADSKKNLNLNRWSPYKLCMNQKEEVDSGNNIVSVVENNLDFVQKANTSIFIAGTHHLNFSHLSSVTEETPQLCGSHIEDGFSIINIDDKNTSPLNSTNSPSDIGDHGEVDSHFSSVDFPSPPLSIDLYVQDEKLESLDDSFPSPPSEAQEFISHISVEDFIACTDAESYVSLESNIGISQPPVQHFSPDRGGHKEILAQLPTVCVTMHDDNNPTFNSETQNNYNNTIQKNSPMTPSPPQPPLNTLPELLLSEWKDLDEEPLEDFEKLEQLCCISGDEGDALGELFLGKLKILESLKRTPDQNTMDDEEKSEETCDPTAAPDLSNLGSKLNIISDQSDLMGKSTSSIILDSQEKSNDLLRSLVQTSEVKDQGSLSKMTTKNGLMMQVTLFPLALFIAKLSFF